MVRVQQTGQSNQHLVLALGAEGQEKQGLLPMLELIGEIVEEQMHQLAVIVELKEKEQWSIANVQAVDEAVVDDAAVAVEQEELLNNVKYHY